VILPGDPETSRIDFGEALWTWWKGHHLSPFEGASTDWGNGLYPTSGAAVRCVALSDGNWDSYLALCRHGGLEMGMGPEGAAERDGRRIFWLTRIVGRVWAALHVYRDVAQRFELSGPWECSLALLKTRGGSLGNFGEGWLEYPDPGANPRVCQEANLLWRGEADEWLHPEELRQMAFRMGAWVEDSWGMETRRFLAHRGPLAGQFDVKHYR
jgi:hypothetical protein